MGSLLVRISPPSFRPERNIPDLSGKIILVTGGNTGIGYETVKQLLLKNAKVYFAARSPGKAAAAIKRLEEETKKSATFLQLDLADLPSVRKAAETFLAQEMRLDILFNNGGVMISPPEQLTAQNHDLRIIWNNIIGHFFLTELLLPALTKSYEETKVPARVINTSSFGHVFALGTAWILSASRPEPSGTRGALYSESKIGNIFFAKAHSDVLVSCALHPGGIKTDLQLHIISFHTTGWMQLLTNVLLYPAPMGAYTQLWGTTVAMPAQITGQYLVPWGTVCKADKHTTNQKLEDEVIAYIREQIKDF
ncbi:NAD-P-binding protein [Mycena sp. CBHHK59/15]|nr:NAD-P-binding protein [Mycena sp. CBHHK59/15]